MSKGEVTSQMAQMSTTINIEHLWKKLKKDGDLAAEKDLIEYYLNLVDQVVFRIAPGLPKNIIKDDLRSYGFVGLIDAVRKFDPERGNQFVTYATWRIRGSILDGLRDSDWLPRSLRDKSKKVEEAYTILEQEKMSSVTDEEVAQYLGITLQELHKVLQDVSISTFSSLDEPIIDDENQESNRKTLIVDDAIQGPEETIVRNSTKDYLTHLINQLPEKEQLVLSLFYFNELSFTEIAEVLGLSTSRISQLHSKAIFRLRGSLGRKSELL